MSPNYFGCGKLKDLCKQTSITQYFFEDIISRNIVMAMVRRPNRKVKKCRIHYLLHTFCLEKAKQENFMLLPTLILMYFLLFWAQGSGCASGKA